MVLTKWKRDEILRLDRNHNKCTHCKDRDRLLRKCTPAKFDGGFSCWICARVSHDLKWYVRDLCIDMKESSLNNITFIGCSEEQSWESFIVISEYFSYRRHQHRVLQPLVWSQVWYKWAMGYAWFDHCRLDSLFKRLSTFTCIVFTWQMSKRHKLAKVESALKDKWHLTVGTSWHLTVGTKIPTVISDKDKRKVLLVFSECAKEDSTVKYRQANTKHIEPMPMTSFEKLVDGSSLMTL